MNMSKRPAIRFSGCTEEWKQSKLQELAAVKDSARVSNTYWADKGIPYIRSSDVTNCDLSGVLFLTREIYEYYKKQTGAPQKGDVLFNGGGDIGKSMLVADNTEIYVQGGAVLYARTSASDLLDGTYLDAFFQSKKAKAYIDIASAGGTMKHFTLRPAANMPVDYPNKTEQRAIGKLIMRLEDILCFHQRKYDKLLTYKKAMLEKMFSKDGADVPEVRFAGFVGKWERCEFEEFFDLLSNNTLSRAELSYEQGKVCNVHYGDILVKFGEMIDLAVDHLPFIADVANISKNSFLQEGDVIIADTAEDSTVGKCSEITGISDTNVVSGLHTIPCRPKRQFAKGYLGYFMNSPAYHDQLLPLMQGTKVTSVSKSALQHTVLRYPVDIAEQTQIGCFFITLERLIILQKRKVDGLKKVKSALLNKMFI